MVLIKSFAFKINNKYIGIVHYNCELKRKLRIKIQL